RRPYERYFGVEGFGLDAHRGNPSSRTWDRDDLGPKETVLGVRDGTEAMGYPARSVRANGGVVVDQVGSQPIVVVATDEELVAYRHPGGEAHLDDDRLVIDGRAYHPATGVGEAGDDLERVPAIRLFAFTWQDDHGPDAFYLADG
ncbi:MAG: DUF3179 domain-containing (seleno)protein, partial [Halobacteriota archaeon]